LAFLPLGALEWHERHNPVGLDGLKAKGLAMRSALHCGGLVFPTLYYGENREAELIEMFPEFQKVIAARMGIDPENFSAGYMGRSILEQTTSYHHLLFHTLCEISSLGFETIVCVAGHYPLKDHAETVARIFHQFSARTRRMERVPVVWAFSDWDLVEDLYPDAADHAGFWETSLLMALEPGLVDLSEIPGNEDELIGVLNSDRPVRESNAEFGEEAILRILERIDLGVRDRMANPERYYPW
jgi:creatinine amidohydrolase